MEAVAISEEYRADFGGPLKPPAPVTAFRYKASAHKAKKAGKGKPKPEVAPAKVEAPAPPKANPKVAGLQKRLATARKKLDVAKTAGTPTRLLEDRVYEIEDELRLAEQAKRGRQSLATLVRQAVLFQVVKNLLPPESGGGAQGRAEKNRFRALRWR